MQQTRTYREQSRAFLDKAREELDAGDLVLASEKAWGAAAMMVKAVAEQRQGDCKVARQLLSEVLFPSSPRRRGPRPPSCCHMKPVRLRFVQRHETLQSSCEQRGIPHEGHNGLWRIVEDLDSETGDEELIDLFHSAGGLHKNFYENRLRPRTVRRGIQRIEQFVVKVERLL